MSQSYEVAHIDELDAFPVDDEGLTWRPIRRRFGISAFGTNAYTAERAPPGSVLLAMLPDTGERYLSTPLFADIPADMTEEEQQIARPDLSPARGLARMVLIAHRPRNGNPKESVHIVHVAAAVETGGGRVAAQQHGVQQPCRARLPQQRGPGHLRRRARQLHPQRHRLQRRLQAAVHACRR